MSVSLAVLGSLDAPARGHRVHLEATWNDHESDAVGYVVIDGLVRGVASGGLRMRSGCTADEVRGLASGMTLKEALHFEEGARYVPLGGAKGGIDFDPYHPDAEAVLGRFLHAMQPLIERHWTMGEDFGVQQATIDSLVPAYGLTSSIHAAYQLSEDPDAARARMSVAFDSMVDGVSLDELVGGYGVAESALAIMERRSMAPASSTAVVQGFGSMGGATARYLAAAGVRVIGVVDVDGVIHNEVGLDVEALLRARDSKGRIDRGALRPSDSELPGDQWLAVATDVLVPAAVSYCINEGNVDDVRARLIVEAANMPVTAAAEATLFARGVDVAPDFLVNSATNAWWWWVFFGDVDGTPRQSFDKITDRMRALNNEIVNSADAAGITLRDAALRVATTNLDVIHRRFPLY